MKLSRFSLVSVCALGLGVCASAVFGSSGAMGFSGTPTISGLQLLTLTVVMTGAYHLITRQSKARVMAPVKSQRKDTPVIIVRRGNKYN